MPLSDIATITVSTAGAGVTRTGFGVPLILGYNATFGELVRTYTSLSAVGDDFAANTPEYLAAEAIFSQSPKVPRIMIGRGTLKPTQRYSVGVQKVSLSTDYELRVAVATGVVWPSQDALYQSASGPGASAWSPSALWTVGDAVMIGDNFYSCLGRSGPSGLGQPGYIHTGYGAASGPSGIGSSIPEGHVWWMFAGTGGSVGTGITNDVIVNGLRGKIDMLSAPAVFGSGPNQVITSLQGSSPSRTLRILVNGAGKFVGVQAYDRNVLNLAQDHSDPGVATDLAAVKNANNTWYGLVTTHNSEDVIAAAAAWVETNSKLYSAASADTTIPRVAESTATDVAADMKDQAYARSWVFFHPSPDEFADAAQIGKFFPIDPGGETWRMKTLSGVTVESFTDTEVTNMRAKYAHYYYDIGGRNVVGGDAKTASGEYVDVTRFIDWYTAELQAKLANLAIGVNKIPFTDDGIALVEAKIRQQNDEGIAAGGIAASPAPEITVPEAADISSEDKADRELDGVVTEWTLAGAVHHITVTVTANT